MEYISDCFVLHFVEIGVYKSNSQAFDDTIFNFRMFKVGQILIIVCAMLFK